MHHATNTLLPRVKSRRAQGTSHRDPRVTNHRGLRAMSPRVTQPDPIIAFLRQTASAAITRPRDTTSTNVESGNSTTLSVRETARPSRPETDRDVRSKPRESKQ